MRHAQTNKQKKCNETLTRISKRRRTAMLRCRDFSEWSMSDRQVSMCSYGKPNDAQPSRCVLRNCFGWMTKSIGQILTTLRDENDRFCPSFMRQWHSAQETTLYYILYIIICYILLYISVAMCTRGRSQNADRQQTENLEVHKWSRRDGTCWPNSPVQSPSIHCVLFVAVTQCSPRCWCLCLADSTAVFYESGNCWLYNVDDYGECRRFRRSTKHDVSSKLFRRVAQFSNLRSVVTGQDEISRVSSERANQLRCLVNSQPNALAALVRCGD